MCVRAAHDYFVLCEVEGRCTRTQAKATRVCCYPAAGHMSGVAYSRVHTVAGRSRAGQHAAWPRAPVSTRCARPARPANVRLRTYRLASHACMRSHANEARIYVRYTTYARAAPCRGRTRTSHSSRRVRTRVPPATLHAWMQAPGEPQPCVAVRCTCRWGSVLRHHQLCVCCFFPHACVRLQTLGLSNSTTRFHSLCE